MASPVSAGDIVGELCRVVTVKSTGATINQGDVVQYTSTGFQQAPASANLAGPFFVCFKAITTQATVDVVEEGEVYVVADGTINPGNYVQTSSSTAGRVVAFAGRAGYTADTVGIKNAAIDWQRVVGIYQGHVDEGAPTGGTPTNAATADTIRMLLIH